MPNKDFNEDHFFTFTMNNFLSTPEGREVLEKTVKDSDSKLYKKITKNLEHHQTTMDKIKKMQESQQVALNSADTPAVGTPPPTMTPPTQSMKIPVPMSKQYKPFTG